jgi:hypothetical protein
MEAGGGSGPGDGARPAAVSDAPVDPLALVRSALAEDPAAGLEAVARLRPLLDAWEEQQVARARGAGWNWAEIAKKLGRHRQAVHREYARRGRLNGPRSTSPGDGGR